MFIKSVLLKFPLVILDKIRLKSTKPIQKNSKLNNLIEIMSRDRKYIAEAQKQRLRIKEKSNRYSAGLVNLQILGNGSIGTPASVYLFTDQSRYLFNCGEGTQRLAHEHKTKLSRLEHIFMTRTSWNRIGGLPGLSLTVQDAGVPSLTLHGPAGLDEIFHAMRRFVVLRDLKVETVICEEDGIYDDQIMSVRYLPIKRRHQKLNQNEQNESMKTDDSSSEAFEFDETDYYAHEQKADKAEASTEKLTIRSERREESNVMCYICKLKPKQGILNLEKCVDRAVPPGPLLGQLKNGEDVTLPDGSVVKAEDVTSPVDPGPVFIFLDIPSEDYFDSFVECSPIFEKYQMTASADDDAAAVVVHFSPEHIVHNKIYENFINKFPASTKHLLLNESNKFSGYVASHRIQWQLNQLNEHMFPILSEASEFDRSNFSQNKKIKLSPKNELESPHFKQKTVQNSNVFVDQTNSLTCYHLRPRKGLDRSNEPIIDSSEYLNETHMVEGFTESLDELRMQLREKYDGLNANLERVYPEIIFLGTGSCIPNKTRNVSAILINTNEDSSILLDCGEGTWGQIVRFYGKLEAEKVLHKLKAIYISHLHADHHIGLIGLLKSRQELLGKECKPIMLLAPKQISSWLNFYDRRIESIGGEYDLVPNADLVKNPLSNNDTLEMGIRSITTCFVRHCPHSFGVSLEIEETESNQDEIIKITYSGDTMPSEDLVELGKNSTVLIHEATMENELLKEARIKMHSTVIQAIEQGDKMNAQFTLLTHFSQRYAKLPRIENTLNRNVGIAFDNMKVTMKDLNSLSLFYPTLKLMFAEHCEEMEQKAIKRALKKERTTNMQSPVESKLNSAIVR